MKKVSMVHMLQGICTLAAGMALCLPVVAHAANASGPYHVAAHWHVGGNSWWDYMGIDPVSHLLYVTHGDQVLVVNTATGKVKTRITGLKGVHGVVFDTSGKYGYISDGRADDVVVFNRKTDQIIDRVPAGKNPDGIVFEPVTQTVWAFNGGSHTATVISDATHKVVATVPLPGRPEFPVADGRGDVYDNITNLSEIARINARTHKITAVWPIAPCEHPSGLAIDRTHRRLFSVCDGVMAVVNADTGKVVATPKIGDGPDAARFDPKLQLAFSTNGNTGTLSVVRENSPDSYTVTQTLPTQHGARTMAINQVTGTIYTDTADFGPRPKPTAENPRPRPSMVPGSFVVLEVKR